MAGRFALVFLFIAAAGFTRNHAVLPPPAFTFGPAKNILWIGAHPDDEVLASPFLGVACKESGARCTFLVMTKGEAGNCGLPEGCFPDLGTVRAAEMRVPWDYLLLDVQQHRSQFTPEQVQLLREIPLEQRYVDFAEPSAASMVSPCP